MPEWARRFKMNIIGYCKECSTIIHHEDRIDSTNVYECSKCKHPQTKEEVELGPFEIKKSEVVSMKIKTVERESNSIKEIIKPISDFCKTHKDCTGCFLYLILGGCALNDTPNLWQKNLEAIKTVNDY